MRCRFGDGLVGAPTGVVGCWRGERDDASISKQLFDHVTQGADGRVFSGGPVEAGSDIEDDGLAPWPDVAQGCRCRVAYVAHGYLAVLAAHEYFISRGGMQNAGDTSGVARVLRGALSEVGLGEGDGIAGANGASNDAARDGLFYYVLHGTAHRAGAKLGVVPFPHHHLDEVGGDGEGVAFLGHTVLEFTEE